MGKEGLLFFQHGLLCCLAWCANLIWNAACCCVVIYSIMNSLWQSGFCFRQIVESTHLSPAPLLSLKDAPGISSNIIYCYDGDDPRISHPHRAAPSRVQHSAAPSMLGNVQRTALSALLPSSSCEFEKEEPKCQWHPYSTPYQPCNQSLFMTNK